MNLARATLTIIVILCVGCSTFKVPKNATIKQKSIFREANYHAKGILTEVKNYYLHPTSESYCMPSKDQVMDPELIFKFLNRSNYEIRLSEYNEFSLDVSFFNKKKSDLFGLEVKLKNGKCEEFTLSQGYICKG